MQTPPKNEQEIIVRGSEEHREYLEHRHGWHLDAVNKLETRLAIWGRPLLLAYVVYTVVKAALIHALDLSNPGIKYVLLGLDAIMLLLQVLGLEGSMSGLLHLADEMEASGKVKEAKSMRNSSTLVQWMLGATAVDLVLQATPQISLAAIGIKTPFDTAALAATYTNLLLIARVVAVGFYLTSMAKLSHRGPKVISPIEAKKQAEEQEQKQIRIDNANIMAVFSQAIEEWTKRQPNLNASFSEAVNRLNETVKLKLESIEAAQNDRIDALSRYVESAQIGSTGSGSIDSKTVELQIESALSRSLADLSRSFEAKLGELHRQVNQMEPAATRHISAALRAPQSSTTVSTNNTAKEPDKARAHKDPNEAKRVEDLQERDTDEMDTQSGQGETLDTKARVRAYVASHQKYTHADIANALGISTKSVQRALTAIQQEEEKGRLHLVQ